MKKIKISDIDLVAIIAETILLEFNKPIPLPIFQKHVTKIIDGFMGRPPSSHIDREFNYREHGKLKVLYVPKRSETVESIAYKLTKIEEFSATHGYFISQTNILYNYNGYQSVVIKDVDDFVQHFSDKEASADELIFYSIRIEFEGIYYPESKEGVYYHITDSKHLESILRKGLRPKRSRNKILNYPPRVYLAKNIDAALYLDEFFVDPEYKHDFGSEGRIILRVTLPPNTDVHTDIQLDDCVFVLQSIPPQYIEIERRL